VALPLMIVIMLTDIRYWFKISYKLFLFGVCLLIAVKLFGVIGGLGAQRWLQALVQCRARHDKSRDPRRI
jgi:rod shape determining protein RodA